MTTNMISYQYSILRYVHDSSIGEYLNMGVAVFVPSCSWFSGKVPVETAARFRLAFTDFNLDWYLKYVGRINEKFYDASINIFTSNLEDIIREAGFRKDNNFVYSTISSGIVQNSPEKYQELFDRLLKTYVHVSED